MVMTLLACLLGGFLIAPAAPTCNAALWQHVYKPERLHVIESCITVTGTVMDATRGKRKDGARHEPDGDDHSWIKLDPPYASMLNAGNERHEGGNLVFEIPCLFQVTQADAKAACRGYRAGLKLPPVGARVRITGSFVEDGHHGWREIHPVSSIDVLPGSSVSDTPNSVTAHTELPRYLADTPSVWRQVKRTDISNLIRREASIVVALAAREITRIPPETVGASHPDREAFTNTLSPPCAHQRIDGHHQSDSGWSANSNRIDLFQLLWLPRFALADCDACQGC